MEITRLDMAPGALAEYYDWLKAANDGDRLVYWTGDLRFDRQVATSETDLLWPPDHLNVAQLNAVASRILADSKTGELRLTQKKLSEGVYEYRATRRRQTYGSSTSVLPYDQFVFP
jgi:hypothetical protein